MYMLTKLPTDPDCPSMEKIIDFFSTPPIDLVNMAARQKCFLYHAVVLPKQVSTIQGGMIVFEKSLGDLVDGFRAGFICSGVKTISSLKAIAAGMEANLPQPAKPKSLKQLDNMQKLVAKLDGVQQVSSVSEAPAVEPRAASTSPPGTNNGPSTEPSLQPTIVANDVLQWPDWLQKHMARSKIMEWLQANVELEPCEEDLKTFSRKMLLSLGRVQEVVAIAKSFAENARAALRVPQMQEAQEPDWHVELEKEVKSQLEQVVRSFDLDIRGIKGGVASPVGIGRMQARLRRY